MCGIAGAFNLTDRTLLESMVEVLKHRGPDSAGFHVDENVMLGAARLAIIDIAGSDQPIYNEDASIVAVYNGEVYNFRDIRSNLRSSGHTFATEGDAEVIVHSYEEDGLSCVRRFNGMFAFALWDQKNKRLVLARDSVGIKPLYYGIHEGSLLFASELKAILQNEEIRPSLDLAAAYDHLNLRFTPYDRTLLTGIRRLMPGDVAIVSGRPTTIQVYSMRVVPPPFPSSLPIGSAELRGLLSESVSSHMISDVEVGVFLSGGIDSSTIAALAQQESRDKVKTFCMGFGDETDELDDARHVAEFLGSDHKEIILEPHPTKDFAKIIWHADAPKRNLWPYYLSKFASRYVKVALSGLGADELFGGYLWRYRKFARLLGADHNATIQAKCETYLSSYAMDLLPAPEIDGWLGPRFGGFSREHWGNLIAPYFTDGANPLDQTFRADFHLKLQHDFLFVDDSTSMANSLETRTPFLDFRLINRAFAIPASQKISESAGKLILIEAMRDMLPVETMSKKKQGFGPNPMNAFNRELREMASSVLPNGSCVKLGLFNPAFIKRVLEAPSDSGLVTHYNKIWDLVAFELWYNMYFESDFKKLCRSYRG